MNMKIIILCTVFIFFVFGCSSSSKLPPKLSDPTSEFKAKFKVSKTVRHPLPKFDDTNDNRKLYRIKLNRIKKTGSQINANRSKFY